MILFRKFVRTHRVMLPTLFERVLRPYLGNMKRALEFLGGGVLVYGLAAACGSGVDAPAAATIAGSGGQVGTLGTGGSGGAVTEHDSAADTLIDALTDPVREANAQPSGLRTETVPCDKRYTSNSVGRWYAELLLPGWSVAQLTSVRAFTNTGPGSGPPSYDASPMTVFLKEGGVAVSCAEGLTITFVIP